MFTNNNANIFINAGGKNIDEIGQRERQRGSLNQRYKENQIKQSRQNQKTRLRMLINSAKLPYQGIKYKNFVKMIQNTDNPYCILQTVFSIVDQFAWRQYIYHLQTLLKKLTNILQQSHGHFLCQLQQKSIQSSNFQQQNPLHDFQQKLQKMLYLSDRTLQEHLLILIHCLIVYNPIYQVVDEEKLSKHLLHRHSYEKYVDQAVIWLMVRMKVSVQAVDKILKLYINAEVEFKEKILLPVLSILSNFVCRVQCLIVEQCVANQILQQIINDGLFSTIYETQRETVLLCNNIIFKNQNCQNYLLSRQSLVSKIIELNNQQSNTFKSFIKNLQNNLQQSYIPQN